MKPRNMQPAFCSLVVVLVLLTTCPPPTSPNADITAFVVVGVGVSAVVGHWWWSKGFCYYKECCTPGMGWISFNRSGLEADLERKLFGQHIASRVIVKAVSGFMNDEKRKKPLVLSLHGLTGTGKSHVSRLIAENIYREGMGSKFVHYFNAEYHFSHANEIDSYKKYKSELRQSIIGNVTNCPTSMFIFDEMDKMHPGLIDTIAAFLDYYDKLDGVSYRKAIFIFLSNAGGNTIVEKTQDFVTEGRDRVEIQLKDLETALARAVFNSKQSAYTSLIDKNLVDFFVPFLPLEYKHVVLCAKAVMADKGLISKQADDVAEKVAKEELIYFPPHKIFSVKGCKTIQSKLDYYL